MDATYLLPHYQNSEKGFRFTVVIAFVKKFYNWTVELCCIYYWMIIYVNYMIFFLSIFKYYFLINKCHQHVSIYVLYGSCILKKIQTICFKRNSSSRLHWWPISANKYELLKKTSENAKQGRTFFIKKNARARSLSSLILLLRQRPAVARNMFCLRKIFSYASFFCVQSVPYVDWFMWNLYGFY